MRQVVAEQAGGPEVLRVVDAPDPEPGPGEVLIAAEAVGVNFADVWARLGVDGKPPYRPGIEVAGTVVALGPGVTAPPRRTPRPPHTPSWSAPRPTCASRCRRTCRPPRVPRCRSTS